MSTTNDPARASRLHKHFHASISGHQQLSKQNYKLFIESVCVQTDRAACIEKLLSSDQGLKCLQQSMRFDLTPVFFNGLANLLLQYLSSPEIASISGGMYLQQILLAIVEPPLFWSAFKRSFTALELSEQAQHSFAWLLQLLIQFAGDTSASYRAVAQDPNVLDPLLKSSSLQIRSIAQSIKHIITTCGVGATLEDYGPGGRHDNDFADFRSITILPTPDELMSTQLPYMRTGAAIEDPETAGSRVATHLDNQFRLLREDMLYEMREELQVALGIKKGKYRGLVMDGLTLVDVHRESNGKACKWGLVMKCRNDFWQLRKVKAKDRRNYLTQNRNIFKHGSMTCLLLNGQIAAFPSVNRDEDLLSRSPPVIVLQLDGPSSAARTLEGLLSAQDVRLLQIDTAVFAYEPVLSALKQITQLRLSHEILQWTTDSVPEPPPHHPTGLISAIASRRGTELKSLLGTTRSVILDEAQCDALVDGLSQRLSLIQGPPGTGKSFIGALLAKVLHDTSDCTILVVCYTNHALDQFLEDLLDIGIPSSSLARLGGKSTARTEPFSIHKLLSDRGNYRKLGRADWQQIDALKASLSLSRDDLLRSFTEYMNFNPSPQKFLEYLEFEAHEFFVAFEVPKDDDGMERVGKRGQKVGPSYLFDRWRKGENAGIFRDSPHVKGARSIWDMSPFARNEQFARWKGNMVRELIERISAVGTEYNDTLTNIDRKFNESVAATLRSKRIVGCTTTAAAKYRDDIRSANPGVLLVEEAGEILESHILTALGPRTEHLILIGDHKQLRPKVSNFLLTVEKGEGYDLNRSLFERLVLKGYPHATLSKQHRMRPEISELVRHLTYPELKDAASTQNRENLRGIQDNVVFINHEKPEDEDEDVAERKDVTMKTSKRNKFEVSMVLKIVRYLAQQGYGTDKIVILVPYLGQLRALQDALKDDNDPILNDLDSHDLVRAGLISPSAAKLSKKPIHLATIDNYQGEESDIVIASLTRSNPNHDIGFMTSPERVNVLLSRARNGLIIIGNAETFQKSRKGGEIWGKLFDLLGKRGHIYEGLPIRCERHPDRTALLSSSDDFEVKTPDGGCSEPCTSMLSCGVHHCPSRCHQLYDHSKMKCEVIIYSQCPKSHAQRYMCHTGPPATCLKCDRDKKLDEKRKQQEFLLQEKRDAEQRQHDEKLAQIDAQIARERDALRDVQLADERKSALEQKLRDLEEAKRLATQVRSPPVPQVVQPQQVQEIPPTRPKSVGGDDVSKSKTTTPPKVSIVSTDRRPLAPPDSAARKDWQRQKDMEGASNDAIDAIMEMVGLENVKAEVLNIKATLDLSMRQGTSTTRDRYNVCMLGNPGTGKTTVARHYGKFLASVQVISGNLFVETTGSSLANDGVPGVKKMIEDVLKAGGGTVFVDEAYQLTSQHNFQGGQVLDFLLAEMENQVGKIAFIFAGYNKEMEKFFEHNPGLNSRVPFRFQFKDYEDSELLGMLERLISRHYSGRMKVDGEDGIRGLHGRIAIRRLGRGRGKDGFGNARALENLFATIRRRQGARIKTERTAGKQPDDLLLTKEDLIGPDPSQVVVESESWKKLQSMIGLKTIKQSVKDFFDMSYTNYQRELKELEPQQISLNRVFVGSPGTGKTTVAKLYGKILAELGLISNGEVVMKNPADFIGSALGQSESQTKAILANTVGKVLIIDEAYMLYGGSNAGSIGTSDPYKTAVIDTIVAEVQSTPGEDRCVLLLGYKHQIEEMFQNVNPGLARRFAIENAFHFEDYSDSELREALDWKLRSQDLTATDVAKDIAIDVLARARNRPNFGNIGEVENLLSRAKTLFQKRQATLPLDKRSPVAPFEPEDFDPDHKRAENAAVNLAKLFEDVVGCEDTIKKLASFQQMAQAMKLRGMDPRESVPTNFIFKGPPGTGKTTTARKMGQVYYDMGFLSSTEVIECSASDLVGQYVGQTGPKTRKLFEKALGKVLFVDEAYRLSEGHFAKEAMDELVGILTQETFRGKLIVILAGYDREMNDLLAVNSGLSSRFPEEIIFTNMSPSHCLQVLRNKLEKKGIKLSGLEDGTSATYLRMFDLIQELSGLPSWGNARDIDALSKKMTTHVFTTLNSPRSTSSSDSGLVLQDDDAIACTETMLLDRKERVSNVPPPKEPSKLMELLSSRDPPPPPVTLTTQATTAKTAPPVQKPDLIRNDGDVGRDPGVTDDVWRRLQADKLAELETKIRAEKEIKALQENAKEAQRKADKERALQEQLRKQAEKAKNDAQKAELMRRREEARLREAAAREQQARAAAEREAKRKEEERRRQEDARVQAKIRQMGVCVAGYRWIKQEGGYRCAGGYHFIDNAALGI